MSARSRLAATAVLTGYYAWNFLRANGQVLYEVVTPKSRMAPSIVRIPAHGDRPWKVGLFAHMISLMPGTLALEVGDDHRTLYVHALYGGSADDLREELAALEARLLAVVG